MAADRAILRELLASGGRGDEPRGAGAVPHIHVPKMGEAKNAKAFLETLQGVAEVSRWPRQEWAHVSCHSCRGRPSSQPTVCQLGPNGTTGPTLRLCPAAAGPSEEMAGPEAEHAGGGHRPGSPGEVHRGASGQNLHLGPVPPLGCRRPRREPPAPPPMNQRPPTPVVMRTAWPLPAGVPYDGGGQGRPRHRCPSPPHGPGEAYSIPVRIQRGTYQALLDSGCMQTMIHQRLVRSEALVEASSVPVGCIHGDVHEYPLENRYGGKKH